jgi:hypothetical protein
MITFTVHEPPDAPADRFDRAESLVFVRDGFTWAAAAFGPFWMLANRLWLVLVGYLVLIGALQLVVLMLGSGQHTLSYVMLGIGLLLGFEADSLKRWTLQRNGWRMVGNVTGRNISECERRFFESWLPGQPYVQSKALAQSSLAGGPERVPFASEAPKPASSRPAGGWQSAFGLSGLRGP